MKIMTPEQATTFNQYSPVNAAEVTARLECGCQPYQDVFTYNRWKAQGQQVQRGQKAIKLPVIVVKKDEETEEVKRLFRTSNVFCRHQVKPSNGHEPQPEPVKQVAKVAAIKEPETKQPDEIMKEWRVI